MVTTGIVGCGGGGGGGAPNNPAVPDTRTVVNGRVVLPAGEASDLTVLAGANEPAAVKDGAFSVRLRDDAPALMTAVNANDEPVLMAVSPTPATKAATRAATPPVLNAQTTAVAMVYLMPYIAQAEPDDEQAMLSLITGLPETAALASALQDALTASPGSPPLDNASVRAALTNATNATLRAAAAASTKGRAILYVDPPTEQSYVSVAEKPVQHNVSRRTFEIKNRGRRWVVAVMRPSKEWVMMPSADSLLSFHPFGSRYQTATLSTDVWGLEDYSVDVYGLGLKAGGPNIDPSSEEWTYYQRAGIATLLGDIVSPVLKTVCNIPSVPSSVLQALAEMGDAGTVLSQYANYLRNGQVQEAFLSVAKWALDKLLADDGRLLALALGSVANAGEVAKAVAKLVALPYKILSVASELVGFIEAAKDLSNCKSKEVFLVTGTGDAIVGVK
ncbi:MAG: hypothetical protein COZ06_27025 [Armatimonadetes bacterium CG_4_10_14_3_um_filter_66_18]|nr:hypothetical protein [Armatimonadota bacterium]OIP01728.1 MAG: hypothetical protein AUJ96_17225 [Armatimonadetes bacterium CG2_30_66_41]PIU88011.1 MAG: hypothetical protein COS65_31805 [Armatimonadetes bacterium CG06_land_8_20_14_3_00_66_21]PIX44710.1 MAG: hypothetical protein COZ57_16970 [Armatimonadetes bacterium CG_4_8_14_3_um_filter_66_20]PIY41164.1 MAG: hypothetical protein COZ06_27025 [Armatimonadetes bacterium CG_4_10_14_3_um_filter_66_18]